ncbi:MAG: acyl carrier protein, partial [Actinomycetota bacterium]|nr:acyl carrier protein [Actinomycetota bacterium]
SRAVLQARPALRERARMLGLLPFDHPGADAVSSVLQAESGIGLLDAEQLDRALDGVLAGPVGVEFSAGVVDLDRYVALCQRLAPRALLSELDSAGAPAESDTPLRRELAGLSGQRRADRVLNLVLATAGSVLGLTAREVDPDGGFFDLGMDSITALSLKTQLELETGTELPATLTFELPTPRKLAGHLLGLLEAASTGSEPAASPQTMTARSAAEAYNAFKASAAVAQPAAADGQPAGTADDPAEVTDEELLRLLSQATTAARDLLQEASQW